VIDGLALVGECTQVLGALCLTPAAPFPFLIAAPLLGPLAGTLFVGQTLLRMRACSDEQAPKGLWDLVRQLLRAAI